jgi:hypothetical protein
MLSNETAACKRSTPRDRFVEVCEGLELHLPWRSAAEQRRMIWTAIWDGLDAAGLAPVLGPDGGLSVCLADETVMVAFDTVPATYRDLERRRALEATGA